MHKLRSGSTLHVLPVPDCIILQYVIYFHLLSILNLEHQGHIWTIYLTDVHFEDFCRISVKWNLCALTMPLMVLNATFCHTFLWFIRHTPCPISNYTQPWTLGSLLPRTMISQWTSAITKTFSPSHVCVVLQSWRCIAVVMSCAVVIEKYHHCHVLLLSCGMACRHVQCQSLLSSFLLAPTFPTFSTNNQ
jgi:hypothetical protein